MSNDHNHDSDRTVTPSDRQPADGVGPDQDRFVRVCVSPSPRADQTLEGMVNEAIAEAEAGGARLVDIETSEHGVEAFASRTIVCVFARTDAPDDRQTFLTDIESDD